MATYKINPQPSRNWKPNDHAVIHDNCSGYGVRILSIDWSTKICKVYNLCSHWELEVNVDCLFQSPIQQPRKVNDVMKFLEGFDHYRFDLDRELERRRADPLYFYLKDNGFI